jgi:DNA polymerase III alpha subunit (gram-positive type)
MLLAMYVLKSCRHTLPNFKLNTICRALNIPWDDDKAHDAMYDIEQTRWVMQALETEYGLKGVGNAQRP